MGFTKNGFPVIKIRIRYHLSIISKNSCMIDEFAFYQGSILRYTLVHVILVFKCQYLKDSSG